jgi:hypothetical protein
MSGSKTISQRVWKNIVDTAAAAIRKESADELTESEKSCIALIAGVPMEETELNGNVLTFTTAPCCVVKDGDKWRVFTKAGECDG